MSRPKSNKICPCCGGKAIANGLCMKSYMRERRANPPPQEKTDIMQPELFHYLYRFPPPEPSAFGSKGERFRGYRKPKYIIDIERGKKEQASVGGWQDA